MDLSSPETIEQSDDAIVRAGTRFGYGHWLRPIVEANDLHRTSPELDVTSDATESAPARRGRGRPRVHKPRDESAIEKRRAQVREAQRTYQKRKDSVVASERRRCDDVLQVMSDLATDIEALLQAASKAGALNQEGELADRIRQLWSAYDTAINSPCVRPELRLLQVKNDRRRAEHHSNDNFRIDAALDSQARPPHQPPQAEQSGDNDPSQMDIELVRVGETTLLQPFSQISTSNRVMAGRSIFEVVRERQAQFHSSQSPASN